MTKVYQNEVESREKITISWLCVEMSCFLFYLFLPVSQGYHDFPQSQDKAKGSSSGTLQFCDVAALNTS